MGTDAARVEEEEIILMSRKNTKCQCYKNFNLKSFLSRFLIVGHNAGKVLLKCRNCGSIFISTEE